MQNKKYKMMEWHRGEFVPVKSTKPNGDKGEGRTVSITEKDADELNRDFSTVRGIGSKIKYIEADEEVAITTKKQSGDDPELLKKVQEEYAKVFGKKAYHAWTIEQLKEKIENK